MQDMGQLAGMLDLVAIQLPVPLALGISSAAGDIRRSDHSPFWDLGYPGIFITATTEFRAPTYHCYGGADDLGRVNLDFARKVIAATVGAAALQLDHREDAVPAPMGDLPAAVPPPGCDAVAQDCDAGRCVLSPDPQTAFAVTLCAPPAEIPVEGDAECVRPDGTYGLDDCPAGSFCGFWGRPQADPQTRGCHAYCTQDADCEDGRCAGVIGRQAGACTPSCDPLAEDTCPAGTQCSAIASLYPLGITYTCNFGGAVAAGGACGATDCQPNHDCFRVAGVAYSCLPRCDLSAPDCAGGLSCVPDIRQGARENLGHCYPAR